MYTIDKKQRIKDFGALGGQSPVLLDKKYYDEHKSTFHNVAKSPWPFALSWSLFGFFIIFIDYLHYGGSVKNFLFIIALMISIFICWMRDILDESHFFWSTPVQKNIKIGFILFLISEIMLFFSFFWAFFHSSLSPSIFIGGVWPPVGLKIISYKSFPLLNTALLVSSGFFITWSHLEICSKEFGSRLGAAKGLIGCIILGIIFMGIQMYEFKTAPFTISDGIYGSVFYALTGLHGFHVAVGLMLLYTFSWKCLKFDLITRELHLSFLLPTWYWHFVDVVWLFLYFFVYFWGS